MTHDKYGPDGPLKIVKTTDLDDSGASGLEESRPDDDGAAPSAYGKLTLVDPGDFDWHTYKRRPDNHSLQGKLLKQGVPISSLTNWATRDLLVGYLGTSTTSEHSPRVYAGLRIILNHDNASCLLDWLAKNLDLTTKPLSDKEIFSIILNKKMTKISDAWKELLSVVVASPASLNAFINLSKNFPMLANLFNTI